MRCELDDIVVVKLQAHCYEVNGSLEPTAKVTSSGEKLSHWECRKHEQRFSSREEALEHWKTGGTNAR